MCDLCPKSYSTANGLRQHINWHKGIKPKKYDYVFQCDLCPKSFNKKASLDYHIESHNKIRPYKCDLCPRTFNHPDLLKRHKSSSLHSKPNQPAPQTGHKTMDKISSDGKKEDIVVLNDAILQSIKRPVTEIERDQLFVRLGWVFNHWKADEDAAESWSSYAYWKSDDLGKHMCLVCGKLLSKNITAMRDHANIHKGNKPFQCTLCDYSCIHKGGIEGHMRTHHTKEKPYQV